MNLTLTKMKKRAAALLHLVFLSLVVLGLGLLFANGNMGRGISWIKSETYLDSDLFYDHLEKDIRSIFDYAHLREAFEEDGEPAMDKIILTLDYGPNSRVDYTIEDLIRIGESYGYVIRDNWSVAVNEQSQVPHEDPVLIRYKSYDPDPVISEPGEAYGQMRDLCYEALVNYSKYAKVHHGMVHGSTNLSFLLVYKNEDGMISSDYLTYTNVFNPSKEKIKHLGLYVEYDTPSLQINTNMERSLPYIRELAAEPSFFEQTFDYLVLSVNTNFTQPDSYAEELENYRSMRANVINGLIFLAAGMAGCLVTLLYLMARSGYEDSRRSKVVLTPLDHMYGEVCVFIFILFGLLAVYVVRVIGFRVLHLTIARDYWPIAQQLLLYAVLYLIAVLCFFSLLRRYKAKTLITKSWSYKALQDLGEYLSREPSSHNVAYAYLGFLAVNLVLATLCLYFLSEQHIFPNRIVLIVVIIGWAIFDVVVFHLAIKKSLQNDKIFDAVDRISSGAVQGSINLDQFSGKQRLVADHINHIGENMDAAMQAKIRSERFKADLITNVSHDLKTPLTSIINYVDLIKREQIQNEKVRGYLDVLEQKSQRLKTLTEDLVEASKASSGNLKLEITDIDFVELVQQTNGEFAETFHQRRLELISQLPEEVILIEADGRRLWRVLENLYNNAYKYAMERSRVYVDVVRDAGTVVFSIKNISENPLNISGDELTERFVRGDVARTTEGSGLGLSIAQSLTQLQKGDFQIVIDGDLFKVYVKFPIKNPDESGNLAKDMLE